MHELGIVFHIIDTVEQVGRENGVTQVRCVTLDVGQVPLLWQRGHPLVARQCMQYSRN